MYDRWSHSFKGIWLRPSENNKVTLDFPFLCLGQQNAVTGVLDWFCSPVRRQESGYELRRLLVIYCSGGEYQGRVTESTIWESWSRTAAMPLTLAIEKDINRESDVHTSTSIATFDRGYYTRNTQQTRSRIAHLKSNRYQIISSQKCLSFTWTHRSITRDRSKSTLLGKSTRTHFSRSDVSRSAKIGRFISRIGKKCRKSVRYVWLLASRRQHRHPLSLARRRLKSSQIEERAIIHRWGREGRGCRRYQADENRCAMVERGDIFWNNEYVLPGPIEVKPPSLVIRPQSYFFP